MSLNLSSVFHKADTILNRTLSKYVGLKFIGLDQDDENRPYYLLDGDTVTTGFYFKTKRLPVTGQVVDTLKIVPNNEDENEALIEAVEIELLKEDNSFDRFSFRTYKEPHPPNYEWILLMEPNKQAQTTIT